VVDERLTCEIMTWSYAGFTTHEFRRMAREAFETRRLASRVRELLAPIWDWAKREGIRIVVVSASPRDVVVEALACAGLDIAAVAGAVPMMDHDQIAPGMSEAVPYAAHKRTVGLSLLTGHDWLASFGDNSFDVDLLKAARVGVAVCPKPALMARLHEVEGVFLLE
jgi:phosphoserine phosphatase